MKTREYILTIEDSDGQHDFNCVIRRVISPHQINVIADSTSAQLLNCVLGSIGDMLADLVGSVPGMQL